MRTTGSTTIRRAFARTIGTMTTVGLMVFGLAVPSALADTTFTVTGTAGPITYGDPEPTYGYSLGAAVLEAGHVWTTVPVYDSDYDQGDPAGSYAITLVSQGAIEDAGAADVTGDYTITYDPGTLVVEEYGITVTADDATATYGDAEPSFTWTGDPLVTGDTWTTDPACDSDYDAGDPAGRYAITCTGGVIENAANVDVTDSYDITYEPGTLTVAPYAMPNADVEYTGQTLYRTRSSSDTAVQVTLSASIALDESADAGIQCPIDPDMSLEDARVTFLDAETGKVFAKDVRVGAALSGEDCEGIATAFATLSTGPNGVEDYEIRVLLGGSFTGASNAGQLAGDTVVVLQAIPAGIAGGLGTGTLPAIGTTAGAYADGEDAEFFFRFVSSTKKTKPSGGATITIPQDDGSYYEVKTNAITSVTVSGSIGVDRKMVVYAKANVTLFDGLGGSTPVDSTGGTSVQITILDGATDQAAITITAPKTGALLFSNNWVKSGKAWSTLLQTITSSTVALA